MFSKHFFPSILIASKYLYYTITAVLGFGALAVMNLTHLNLYLPVLVFFFLVEILNIVRLFGSAISNRKTITKTDKADILLECVDSLLTASTILLFSAFLYGLWPSAILAFVPKLVSLFISMLRYLGESIVEEGENIIKTFKMGFRTASFIIIVIIVVKLDNILNWSWFKILWPLWIVCSFCILLAVAFVGSIIMKIYKIIFPGSEEETSESSSLVDR